MQPNGNKAVVESRPRPGVQFTTIVWKFLTRPLLAIWSILGSHRIVSFGQGTHTLRPFYSRPTALTQEGRSLVNDVCERVRD